MCCLAVVASHVVLKQICRTGRTAKLQEREWRLLHSSVSVHSTHICYKSTARVVQSACQLEIASQLEIARTWSKPCSVQNQSAMLCSSQPKLRVHGKVLAMMAVPSAIMWGKSEESLMK